MGLLDNLNARVLNIVGNRLITRLVALRQRVGNELNAISMAFNNNNNNNVNNNNVNNANVNQNNIHRQNMDAAAVLNRFYLHAQNIRA